MASRLGGNAGTSLADGSETRLDVTGGQIEFMGETTWGGDCVREGCRRALCRG